MLLTQKMFTHTQNSVENYVPEMLHTILLICPRSEVFSEICNFQCLEDGPAELHIGSPGKFKFRKTRMKITQVTIGRINSAIVSALVVSKPDSEGVEKGA